MSHDALLLDLGNSRLKWGLSSDVGIAQSGWIPHSQIGASPALDLAHVSRVGISDVRRGASRELVNQWLGTALPNAEVLEMESQIQTLGLENAYRDVGRLGVDRWMAMLGCPDRGRCSALVVDVGTALTLDAIDADSKHLGGLIAPGPTLMIEATTGRTTGVTIDDDAAVVDWANNTADAIYSGAYWSATSVIESGYEKLRRRLGNPVQLWLTGGGAPIVSSCLSVAHQIDENLVLRGIDAVVRQV